MQTKLYTLDTRGMELMVETGIRLALTHMMKEQKITPSERAVYTRTMKAVCREASGLSKFWRKIWGDADTGNEPIMSLAIIDDVEKDLKDEE